MFAPDGALSPPPAGPPRPVRAGLLLPPFHYRRRRTLSRLFHKSLGQTIHDAITRLRLERAKRRLADPGATVKTVAAECGFRDAIHLCKVFQRVEGVSPSQYRAG